ncbi:MAG: GDP-mannose 4,6-dehydratase [Thermoleophilaceae bacterium]|nr:GDP-mannose 4,6-dehydratase [Thermoleophilaceae bacterium]
MPRALITGITGQDGSYLAELLLEKGYEVHGLARDPDAAAASPNIAPIASHLSFHAGDLGDARSLEAAVATSSPDEVYNLAALSFVGSAWSDPVAVAEVSGVGVARLLAAARSAAPDARFIQASSSEIFGRATAPQGLSTPFGPVNPYGAAKLYAHSIVAGYREALGLHASAAILFNHESPRRGPQFVTRKITRAVAEIAAGKRDSLELGSLEARRDWGFAGDYVEAMWRMAQREEPRDFVIGTGESHSVSELVDTAFRCAGLDPAAHVVTNEALLRPVEIPELLADLSETTAELGWTPTVNFGVLIEMMVEADRTALAG